MRTTGLTLFIWICLFSWVASAQAGDQLVFIVNSQNPVSELSSQQITDLFLKKKRQWPDGDVVRFIDRTDDSPEKDRFLEQVLKRSHREVDLHWIGQKLYSGDSAPQQVRTDSMVASLVGRFKGAIGYVSPRFTGGKGIKRIEVAEAP